jgi:hypothetical protein
MANKYRLVSKEEQEEDKVSKEERIVNYIKSVAAIDDALQPFKEQKKELKGNYVENGWLDKDEIKLAMKAYRMIKDETDWEHLTDLYSVVKRGV